MTPSRAEARASSAAAAPTAPTAAEREIIAKLDALARYAVVHIGYGDSS